MHAVQVTVMGSVIWDLKTNDHRKDPENLASSRDKMLRTVFKVLYLVLAMTSHVVTLSASSACHMLQGTS